MCTLRIQALAQENSRSMQMKGFSPECVSMCFLRLPFSVHLYSHWLQMNGFSPIWTRMCCFRWTELADVKAHIGHLWGSSPPVFVLVLDALYNFRLFLSIKSSFISLSSILKSYGLTKGKSQESPKGSDSGKSDSELKYLKEWPESKFHFNKSKSHLQTSLEYLRVLASPPLNFGGIPKNCVSLTFISHSLRSYHNMSPPDPWKWMVSEKVIWA